MSVAVLNFEDATIRLPGAGGGPPQQTQKHPANNCYKHIPVTLTMAVANDVAFRLRRFLATTFAGNSEGRFLDCCMEALPFYGMPLPQKIIILRGPGGDGKSARSHLRHNVFGGAHRYMSTSVFEVDEEFRRQGGQFGRPNYGITTHCYNCAATCTYWEMNLQGPWCKSPLLEM